MSYVNKRSHAALRHKPELYSRPHQPSRAKWCQGEAGYSGGGDHSAPHFSHSGHVSIHKDML